MDEELPQSDQLPDVPHPRHTAQLFGQADAEAAFLSAFNSGRMHHAWLLTGLRGIGKATLAWKIARFLLSQPSDSGMFSPEPASTLDIPSDNPIARRVAALSEPRLVLARRAYDEKAKRFKSDLTVDEIRNMRGFFSLSAADGGWRVAIIDAADDMNVSAANALLKILEEPPEKTVFFLISHQPARLLPTIRSRCRTLGCAPLLPDEMDAALAQTGLSVTDQRHALHELSQGSVGAAVQYQLSDGLNLYGQLLDLFADPSGGPSQNAVRIADGCAGAANKDRYDMVAQLIFVLLARMAKFGALQPSVFTDIAPHEARILATLVPSAHKGRQLADLAQELGARYAHAKAVHLDPSAVILDMFLKIEETLKD